MDWSTLIPTALGGLIALGSGLTAQLIAARSTRKSDERRHAADRDLHEHDAGLKRSAERDDFQRETLVRLQESLQRMARANGRALFFDHMQARQGQFLQFGAELSQEMHESQVEVRLHSARVLDPRVREAVDVFIADCVDMTMLPTGYKGLDPEEIDARATQLTARMGETFNRVNGIVGEALRDYLSR
jgi:hypothetical protein